ncbi:MAG: TolC family protein [Longimicrobiales bacterium]|jgi:outer membrane protein TolC
MMHASKSERAANEAMVNTVDRIAVWALVLGVVLLALSAVGLLGQQVPDELTLDDAIALAKSNNLTFLSTANDQAAADWQVREAWAQFVPSVTTNIGGPWQEAGAQRFGSFVFEGQRTDWLYTGYGIDASMRIDGRSIFGVPAARANRRATEARSTSPEFELDSRVGFQYMTVLRAEDGVDVAQRQLDRARQNLRIVNTRVEMGPAARTEGKQVEVDLGRAEVVLIQAERDLRQARLMLSEQIGVIVPGDMRHSSEFEVFEPDFEVSDPLVMST